MDTKQVIAVHNVSTTYHVPLLLEKQKLIGTLGELLDLPSIKRDPQIVESGKLMWKDWVDLARGQDYPHDTVSIALVGKYTALKDAYISVSKALEHAAMYCHKKLELIWVDAGHLEDEAFESNPAEFHKAWHAVCTADGLLVPGGFGTRNTTGMIKAITWARTKKRPFLGVCLGMQLAVIEFARNVMNIDDCGSEELHPEAKNHAIIYMPEVCLPCRIDPKRNGLTIFYRLIKIRWVEPCVLESTHLSSKMAPSGLASGPCTAPVSPRSQSATVTVTKSTLRWSRTSRRPV
jgi:CTP synthase